MGASFTSPKASFSGPVAFSYTPLLTSGDDVISLPCSLAAGTMARGTIAKFAFDTGVLAAVAVVADANCIVVDTIDATGGATTGLVYTVAKVRADALVWPALDHGLVTDQLRKCGIWVERVVGTAGAVIKSVGIGEILGGPPGSALPSSTQVPAAGGAGSFDVKTNGNPTTWIPTPSSAASAWLHVTAPTAPETGDATVGYTVDAQVPAAPARMGHIIIPILAIDFVVNQDAGV